MGSLTGGEKDLKPPKVVDSKPVNYSIGFDGQKIEISFNEFIVLKDISKEFVISPPLKVKPLIRIKNKTISIDLKNKLLPNRTYTLYFGKAIADNNEGNPLRNYEFVFSTGNFLDSISIEGRLINAFDLQPPKESVNIMLYQYPEDSITLDSLMLDGDSVLTDIQLKLYEDSIPMKKIPMYIGKTDLKGYFRINNIRADTYKIYALKDQNFNFLSDLPNEEFAFIDTLLILTPEFIRSLPERIDTIPKETDKTLTDTTLRKIIDEPTYRKYNLPSVYVDMYLFKEESRTQYLSNNQRNTPEHVELIFNIPLEKNPIITPLNFSPLGNWYLLEANAKRDSFHLWITDTTYIKQDTLQMELNYLLPPDPLGNSETKIDTVLPLYRRPIKIKSKRNTELELEEEGPKFIVSTIRNKTKINLDRTISFSFNFPLSNTDTSFIKLYMVKDSVKNIHPYNMISDSSSLRKLYLKSTWDEKTTYEFQALPGAFHSIYGDINDTLNFTFETFDIESFGTLNVNMSGVKMPMIVQLMNESGVVLSEKFVSSDTKLIFRYLFPGKFKLKYIYDRNNNRKWDTGYYLKNLQPEKVSYSTEEINIRANWEVELNWNSETNP